jgi:sugar lactone lactonase YvrE
MRICVAFTLLLALSLYAEERTAQQVSQDAKAAYDRKDYPAYLAEMQTLAAMRPGNPIVLANLGGAFALNGEHDEALAQFERLAAMRVAVDLADHDFDAIRETPRFRAAAARIEKARTERVHKATKIVTIPQQGLITEAVVWDAKTKTFLVSANHKKKIVRVDMQGRITDFATEGLWGANGLGIDAKRNLLWASSSPSPRAEGYAEKDDAEMALLAIDLGTGKVVKRIAPPEKGHYFDDLTVAPDGTVYLSDSTGMLFRLRGDKLETLVPRGVMRSAQGSALAGDTLYVSDYATGVWAVDITSGEAARLEAPTGCSTVGIDGLELYDGSLLAIQNGIQPNRVTRLRLDGRRIKSCEILEMNDPLMDEPTIGTVIGSNFWFLAASQGESKGQREGVLMMVPLH